MPPTAISWLVAPLCALGCALWPGLARAQPPTVAPEAAAAVLPAGVLWLDGSSLRLAAWNGASRTLASSGSDGLQGMIADSGNWVAVRTADGLLAGRAPGSLTPVTGGPALAQDGCGGWRIDVSGGSAYAVADGRLVLAASSSCTSPALATSATQPIYERSLRGGAWRILRRLPGDEPPMIAATGSVAAIGRQVSPSTLRVQVVNLDSGRIVARLVTPDGYLSFDGAKRLVVAVPTSSSFPMRDVPPVPGAPNGLGGPLIPIGTPPVSLSIYDVASGRDLGTLGPFATMPVLSRDHLVDLVGSTLEVTDLRSRLTTPIAAFNPPARQLETYAVRWPVLALTQTTAAPAASWSCADGDYGPTSPTALVEVDLAEPFAFSPAPASAPALPMPSGIICPVYA